MNARGTTSAHVTVLHTLRPPTADTTYVTQILSSAPPQVTVRLFSWHQALTGDHDVLHLHWPEHLLRSTARWRRPLAQLLFVLTLLRSSRHRVAVVRTVHNLEPHDPASWLERRLLAFCDRRTDLFVHLNTWTPDVPGTPSRVILHGHYEDRLAAHPRCAREPGAVLFFGRVERYKGVDQLVRSVQGCDRAALRLRVVGRVTDHALRARLEAAAALDERIRLRLEFVTDAQMVDEVTRADIVALPYEEMHNSGVVLVALSLGRRVLVPTTAVNRSIATEVGEGWVVMFDGPLTSDVLAAAVAQPQPTTSPRLEGRDWSLVGRQHHQAYLDALAAVRGPGATEDLEEAARA